jgi:hypothetical protein
MIPRIVHFCFFRDEGPARDLALHEYMAIRSALEHIRPDQIFFHNNVEPSGRYWECLRSRVTRLPCTPPEEIFGRRLHHFAHKADVVRLKALREHGGIYLDMDTICRRSFDPLLGAPCVLGLQQDPHGRPGLCNAVILAEPGASFLEEWFETYRTFRAVGRDENWDEHSVRIPWRLARIKSDGTTERTDLRVEPPSSFFEPVYSPIMLKQLFEQVMPFPNAYCHHLWESFSGQRYLSRLTERLIRDVDTSYNLIARPLLP